MPRSTKTRAKAKQPAKRKRAAKQKASANPVTAPPKQAVADEAARPRSAFALPQHKLERFLLTGESRGALEDYYGPEAYAQLRDLAREASSRSVRGGARVFILPGIMGSTLARTRLGAFEDVLWIDPLEVALGRLNELKLGPGSSPYHAQGVILLAYMKLKLRLRIAGFDADFFPFDWRLGVPELGAALADKVRTDPAPRVNIVAHSMGGLVARAAFRAIDKKLARLVMLGTPNYGSFAPIQALRGAYDVVQKIALVDLRHSPEDLAGQVFSTFPGLYQLMPPADKFSSIDLFDSRAWPQQGPQPDASILKGVKPALNQLCAADPRFYLIAGVNQETVVDLQVENGEFLYTTSRDGDGTVPLAFAELAGLKAGQLYYVDEGHGGLPNNDSVESAVVDLLSSGTTTALSSTRPAPAVRAAPTVVSESKLREMAQRAPGVGELGSSDYRRLLEAVAAPPRMDHDNAAVPVFPAAAGNAPAVSGAAVAQNFKNVTIGRRRQRRIEITLAFGSITEADAPAYVLGVFRNVAPSGPAKAIDERLDGAIAEFTARRMFSGELGAVFTVPIGRSSLPASVVLFAGLGPFDKFNSDVQQLVAENAVRVLVRSRIDEFATVLIGAGTGQSTGSVMQNLLTGYFRGLKDADPKQRFRGITLCERDPSRYAEMKAELYRMAATSLFDDVELLLSEIEIPPPPEITGPRVLDVGQEPVYVIIRQEQSSRKDISFQVSILGAGLKAAVVTAAKEVEAAGLSALLTQFDVAVGPGGVDLNMTEFGEKFANLVLPAEVCAVLLQMQNRHLVVVHDTPSARIPWETLTINNWTPVLTGGLSRRYLADHLPMATWLEERRASQTLQLLLVIDPTSNLPDAVKEGERIQALASTTAGLELETLRQKQATRSAFIAALRTGKYDCVHYAGHAFFDPQIPSHGGLLCADDEVLTGSDLSGISNLPSLMFFNACEGARIRAAASQPTESATVRGARAAGLAEALMRGGIGNYMSTYWPVRDDSANNFASTFYENLLAGRSIGQAMLAGRKAIDPKTNRDWADYVLYGSYDFILKSRHS